MLFPNEFIFILCHKCSQRVSKSCLQTWNCVINKSVRKPKIFFKVSIHFSADSFANPQNCLKEFCGVITSNGFYFTAEPRQGSFVEFHGFLMRFETIRYVVQKSCWYTADTSMWKLLNQSAKYRVTGRHYFRNWEINKYRNLQNIWICPQV